MIYITNPLALPKPVKQPHGPPMGHLHADFNMGLYDFERMDRLMRAQAESMLLVFKEPLASRDALLALKEMYRIMRPLIWNDIKNPRLSKDNLDTRFYTTFKLISDSINTYENNKNAGLKTQFNPRVYVELDNLANDLYEIRQIVGLGMPASRKRDSHNQLGDAIS